MGESTFLDAMYMFCVAMVKVFGKEYLENQMTHLGSWQLILPEDFSRIDVCMHPLHALGVKDYPWLIGEI